MHPHHQFDFVSRSLYLLIVFVDRTDIITPLPAMGIDFTIVPGKGPKIINPISTADDVASLHALEDPATQLPFVSTILKVHYNISSFI
jgi:uroporphyrinogen-III decarboxylase